MALPIEEITKDIITVFDKFCVPLEYRIFWILQFIDAYFEGIKYG